MMHKRFTLVVAFALSVLSAPIAAEAQPAGQARARLGFMGSAPHLHGCTVMEVKNGKGVHAGVYCDDAHLLRQSVYCRRGGAGAPPGPHSRTPPPAS